MKHKKELNKCWECGKLTEKFYCNVECVKKAMQGNEVDDFKKLIKQ